jgi:UDP-N-acetylmuramoylalanine--D-glutamate ligase
MTSQSKLHSAPDLSGKTVIVVGLGASGISAVHFLLRCGARVIGTDSGPTAKVLASARTLPCELVLGGHDGVDFAAADLIVVSPGVPGFPSLFAAEKAGVEVIGESELASRGLKAPLLAVGGTNGKSTTTVLLGHLLEGADFRVFVGGNLGEPACDAPDQDVDAVVLEVSSFQMERVPTFRPKVALLLNVSEDHLDRYERFDDYVMAKGNCFANQQASDYAIYPAGNQHCLQQASRGKAQLVSFGQDGDYFVEGSAIVERKTGERFDLSSADLYGLHNRMNAAAAIAAARVFGVPVGGIVEGLRRFRALPHRMALAGRHQGVSFYDDSKATNVGAAVTALRGLTEEKGVLVAGGRDKMGSYDDLVDALREKGRGAVLLGEAAARLEAAIGSVVPVQRAKTMQVAVLRAFDMAKPGDAVLLSPACSSLDMFKNYADRGDRFTEAVTALSQQDREHSE